MGWCWWWCWWCSPDSIGVVRGEALLLGGCGVKELEGVGSGVGNVSLGIVMLMMMMGHDAIVR